MKFKYRLTILIVLIIIFFIASPLLILWTLGYRWNPKKITVEKTGLLVVKTEPEGADIYLNNKKQKGQTPVKIKYLLPDIYNLRIEKIGFIPYEKKITVKSGLAAFADNILLFKQNLPILLASEEIEKLRLNEKLAPPAAKYENIDIGFLPQDYKNYALDAVSNLFIVFKNRLNDKLLIFDENKKIIFDDYGENVVFNKNNNEFIVFDEFEINLYDINKKEKYFINRSSKEIKNVFFLKDNYIIYALGDGVYATEKYIKDATKTILNLATFNDIQSTYLDDKQENIYILGTINDKSGVYILNFR